MTEPERSDTHVAWRVLKEYVRAIQLERWSLVDELAGILLALNDPPDDAEQEGE
jgi:hypothetical protein